MPMQIQTRPAMAGCLPAPPPLLPDCPHPMFVGPDALSERFPGVPHMHLHQHRTPRAILNTMFVISTPYQLM